MTVTDAGPMKAWASWFSRALRWPLAALQFLFLLLLVTWATLAVYYSNLPWAWLRLALAVAFAAFSVWALWLSRILDRAKPLTADHQSPGLPPAVPPAARRGRRMRLAFAGLFLVVLVWFMSIQSSHDRPWRPEVAVMPRAIIDGDRVRFTGFRHFDYRSRHDFTERWEEREVSLSHLTSVDFFLSCWGVGPFGHTF